MHKYVLFLRLQLSGHHLIQQTLLWASKQASQEQGQYHYSHRTGQRWPPSASTLQADQSNRGITGHTSGLWEVQDKWQQAAGIVA